MIYIEIIDNKVSQSTNNIKIAQNLFKNYITTNYDDYDPNSKKYIYDNGEIILNPDYAKEQAQIERNMLDNLSLTRADVERAIYKTKGMDFEDILELVKNNPEIDIKALKIELKANNFYRGNPWINKIGEILGFNSNQLDEFFKTNDYSKLISSEKKK